MSNKSDLRDYKVYLDGVAPVRVIVQGEHFHILEASSKVTLDFDGRIKYTRVQGQGGDVPKGFKEVWLSSAAPQHVIISLGYGRVRDNTASINNANIQATVKNSNVNNHLPTVNVPAGQAILLANGSDKRKELRIQVDSEQGGPVFIGGLGVSEDTGGLIEVGMIDFISSEGALYAFNPNDEGVKVRLLSLERAS